MNKNQKKWLVISIVVIIVLALGLGLGLGLGLKKQDTQNFQYKNFDDKNLASASGSVEVNWYGNFGNHAFQYMTALIFAKKNGLSLITPLSSKLLEILNIQFDRPAMPMGLEEKRMDSSCYDKNGDLIYYGRKRYVFACYFQHTKYINRNIECIEQYVSPIPYTCSIPYVVSDEDILCIVRLGDFHREGVNSEIVHPITS